MHARKHGARFFLLPGGKPRAGETPALTASRELVEETGLHVEADALISLGHRIMQAANERGYTLEADVFAVPDAELNHEHLARVAPHAEIAQLAWVDAATITHNGCTRAHVRTAAHGGQAALAQGWRLRPVRLDDAAAIADAFIRDPEQMSRQGPVVDQESALSYITWLSDEAEGHYAWVAADPDDQARALVGITVDRENRSGWFFYWSHPCVRGRGVLSTAACAVADQALSPQGLGLDRLELGHRVNNPASGAIARTAGFVLEGRERGKFLMDGERIDVLSYGRLRSDVLADVEEIALAPLSRYVLHDLIDADTTARRRN